MGTDGKPGGFEYGLFFLQRRHCADPLHHDLPGRLHPHGGLRHRLRKRLQRAALQLVEQLQLVEPLRLLQPVRLRLLLLLQSGRQLLLLHERRNEHDLLLGFLQHDLLRIQQQLHGVHLLAVRLGILGLLTLGPAPCARIRRAHGSCRPDADRAWKKTLQFFWKDPLPNRKQPAIIHECRCLR